MDANHLLDRCGSSPSSTPHPIRRLLRASQRTQPATPTSIPDLRSWSYRPRLLTRISNITLQIPSPINPSLRKPLPLRPRDLGTHVPLHLHQRPRRRTAESCLGLLGLRRRSNHRPRRRRCTRMLASTTICPRTRSSREIQGRGPFRMGAENRREEGSRCCQAWKFDVLVVQLDG